MVQPLTRYGVWILFVLAAANGLWLYLLPGQADTDYAWSIKPAVNAAFIGAGFLAYVLLKLVRGAPLGVESAEVDAGVRSHHAVDSAFHDHATFKAWMRVVREELGGTRIAYAAAHVGVELAMDGVLLERERTRAFDDAMGWAREELVGPWRELAERAPEVVDAYRSPSGVA